MPVRAFYDLPAPAKPNLFLHVNGRRADGYHLLQSIFVPIDWCDTLHIERRDDGRLARHDLTISLPESDLCLRAARLLQERSGTPLGADISIDKQVPAGAGMGGGSSDAATTLLALNRLWALNWPRPRLAALALELGADVPFFIGGQPAFVEGIGEKLTPLTLAPLPFAVVKPPQAVATKAIFESAKLVRDTPPVILAGFVAEHGSKADLEKAAAQFLPCERTGGRLFGRNDLQAAAEDVCGEITQALALLESRYGNSRMTGSGSAVFAITNSGTGHPDQATALEDLPAGWVGRQCRSLTLHPLVGWAPGFEG